MPVFAIFFPVNIAIGLTAIVHLVNNLFRTFLIGKFANRKVIIKFGIPAFLAAIAGAYILSEATKLNYPIEYEIFGSQFQVTLIKFIVAILIMIFLLLELTVDPKKFHLEEKYLPIGGILSGFFGGLSGHQGAFRSAFLVQSHLDTREFIATSMVIAVIVDITRIIVYGLGFPTGEIGNKLPILIAACFSAILGSLIASYFIEKTTIKIIKIIVFTLLFAISMALITGII